MKEILLSDGIHVALVDDEDSERISKYSWGAVKKGRTYYARREAGTVGKNRKSFYMHRDVLNLSPGNGLVDHRNRNGLDNQKSNLRLSNKKLNAVNTEKRSGCSSKYKGVYFRKDRQKWSAYIEVNTKRIRLGTFETELQAATAYDVAAKRYYGDYALLNLKAG
jgi:hypothetical protein